MFDRIEVYHPNGNKAQLDALTTVEEIDAYVLVWPDGNMDGTKPS